MVSIGEQGRPAGVCVCLVWELGGMCEGWEV